MEEALDLSFDRLLMMIIILSFHLRLLITSCPFHSASLTKDSETTLYQEDKMEAAKLTFLFYFVVIEKKRNDLFRFQGVGFEVSATDDHALNLKRNQTQATGCK